MRENPYRPPEMYLEIFVNDDSLFENRAFAEMFIMSRCTKAASPEKADIVVFTGGADVNPALYGEDPHVTSQWSHARDDKDIQVYADCLARGTPMFGVCRGAQFLHVMNGGKLYQDVNHHNGDHNMYLIEEKRILQKVSSVHHQMVIPQKGMKILGESHKANVRWRNPRDRVEGNQADVEAFWYEDTACFGVQGHPEYKGYNEFAHWCLMKIDEYIVKNPHTESRDGCRLLKKSFMEERDARWAKERNTNQEAV